MSKSNGYISLDKNLIYYLPRDRAYTELEAMFSFTKDLDDNKTWSINGYAKQWQWSRTRVRHFINSIKTTEGHSKRQFEYSSSTVRVPAVHLINNNLHKQKDSSRTVRGQFEYTSLDTPIKTNIKTKTKTNNIYTSRFEHFWQIYPARNGTKVGKKITFSLFQKLNDDDYDLLIKATTNYSQSDMAMKGYAKDPERFIKNDYWRDWLNINPPENVKKETAEQLARRVVL